MTLALSKQFTFTSGTTILSAQVNSDFDDLYNALSGLESLTSSLTNLRVDTVLRSAGTIQSADGTVAAPGLTFTNGLTDGMYRIGTNNYGFATNGVRRLDISTTGITSTLPIAMGTSKITGLGDGSSAQDAVAFNQLKSSNIAGTTTNDNAPAGYIGEYVESVVGSANVGTTLQFYDITSIELTAGDWDVTGQATFFRNGCTWVNVSLGISVVSGNSGSGLVSGSNFTETTTTATSTVYSAQSLTVPAVRIKGTGTNTVYLKGYSEYTSSPVPTRVARLSARRVR